MFLLNKDIMPYPPSLCKSKIHDVHPSPGAYLDFRCIMKP